MSASFSASLCYGILLSKKDLTETKPNPLYGLCKYDPDTGVKVSEFITTTIDIHKEAEKAGLEVDSTTDSINVVVGKSYGGCYIGEGDPEYCQINELPSVELHEKIIDFAKSLGFYTRTPSIYVLGRCSY